MVNNDTHGLGRRHRSSSPEVLPFAGLNSLTGVAVDSAGNLYVTDSLLNAGTPSAPHFVDSRVVKLPAG